MAAATTDLPVNPEISAPAPDPAASRPEPQVQRAERIIATLLFIAVFIVRIAYVFRYRVDSDEPQHLHVAWQWALGHVAYRDFFDNHTPLFQILFSPIMILIGERSAVLDIARLFMVPLFALALWCVHRLGRSLFSARVALWAPAILGAFPNYFFPTVEFRTDNLWAPLWLLMLAVLINGRARLVTTFLAGVIAGATFATSMKTGLLAGALLAAALATYALAGPHRPRLLSRQTLRHVFAALGGLVIVPGALLIFFATHGAMTSLIECVFTHNILPPEVLVEHRERRWGNFILLVIVFLFMARFVIRVAPSPSLGLRRALILLHGGFLIAAVEFLWPVLTRQNYLPTYPLLVLMLAAALIPLVLGLTSFAGKAGPALAALLLGSVVAGELVWATKARPINEDRTLPADHLVEDALRLTSPNEYVMTYKGESVFRLRPYYYVLEPFTRARLAAGLLPNNIVERLIATKTCVAMTVTRKLPLDVIRFLEDNYIPVGQLRVLGKKLPRINGGVEHVHIVIGTDYSLVGLDAAARAGTMVDGVPFGDSHFLSEGDHVITLPPMTEPPTLLWTRAVERGFKPMAPDAQPELVGSEF
jgi:hypothetical protein